jgi:hypothetical protein
MLQQDMMGYGIEKMGFVDVEFDNKPLTDYMRKVIDAVSLTSLVPFPYPVPLFPI